MKFEDYSISRVVIEDPHFYTIGHIKNKIGEQSKGLSNNFGKGYPIYLRVSHKIRDLLKISNNNGSDYRVIIIRKDKLSSVGKANK